MKIMNGEFGVDNLSASAFINPSGKAIKLSPERLRDRQLGIIFFRFDLKIDTTHEDGRINKEPFFFQFFLQLPHEHFDTLTKKVE